MRSRSCSGDKCDKGDTPPMALTIAGLHGKLSEGQRRHWMELEPQMQVYSAAAASVLAIQQVMMLMMLMLMLMMRSRRMLHPSVCAHRTLRFIASPPHINKWRQQNGMLSGSRSMSPLEKHSRRHLLELSDSNCLHYRVLLSADQQWAINSSSRLNRWWRGSQSSNCCWKTQTRHAPTNQIIPSWPAAQKMRFAQISPHGRMTSANHASKWAEMAESVAVAVAQAVARDLQLSR